MGALVNAGVLIGGLWKLSSMATHMQRVVDYFALEHELVMTDYAERHKIKLDDLPTRLKKAPWWNNK
jgi:hypothetical protein